MYIFPSNSRCDTIRSFIKFVRIFTFYMQSSTHSIARFGVANFLVFTVRNFMFIAQMQSTLNGFKPHLVIASALHCRSSIALHSRCGSEHINLFRFLFVVRLPLQVFMHRQLLNSDILYPCMHWRNIDTCTHLTFDFNPILSCSNKNVIPKVQVAVVY